MSALVTANGIAVVAADFVLPQTRVWHIDMTVSTDDPTKLDGDVTVDINDGALAFKGTASVTETYAGTARCRVVAGKGGMAKLATPKAYQQVTVGTIVGDLLQTAGETLAVADASVFATRLDAWCVTRMPVADAVSILLDHVGVGWRMLPGGEFWCGKEVWADSEITGYTVEHDDKAHRQIVVSLEAPLLLPGDSLDGRNMSYVETHVDSNAVRSTVWLATPGSTDRMRDPIVAMSKSAVASVDYHALYRCTVASQSGQAFDLVPEDPRLPTAGFQSVPLRSGIPGLTVQVPGGTTLLLGWVNGDPSKPYCTLWQGGEPVTQVQLGGTHPMPFFDTFYTDLVAWIGVLNTLLGTLVPGTGATGGPAYASAIALPTSFIVKMAAPTNYQSQKWTNG